MSFITNCRKYYWNKKILSCIKESCEDNFKIINFHNVLQTITTDKEIFLNDISYLIYALQFKNCIPTITLMLDSGFNVNACDANKKNILRYTIMDYKFHNSLELVKLFISRGCDINYIYGYGGTALSVACYKKNYDIVKFLLDNGADPNIGKAIISSRDIEIIKLLLSRDVDINDTCRGNTILYYALLDKTDPNVIEFIIASGCNPNIYRHGKYSDSPLMLAIKHYNVETISLLLRLGAEYDNALEIAAKHEKYDIVKELINYCADYSKLPHLIRDRNVLLEIFDHITIYEITKNNKSIGSKILFNDIPKYHSKFVGNKK